MTADEWDTTTDAPAMMNALHEPFGYSDETIRQLAIRLLQPDPKEIEHFDFWYTPPSASINESFSAEREYHWNCMMMLDHPDTLPPHKAFAGAYRSGFRTADDYANTIREAVGNPFRPVILDPSWLTSTVVALVAGIRAENAFDRMPVLADALMDAGCQCEAVLNHCRQDKPHHDGCWVVRLLLGEN